MRRQQSDLVASEATEPSSNTHRASPTVSVIVCAYSLERWEVLCDALGRLGEQTIPPLETILVIDHNPALLERARSQFPGVEVVANTGASGSSQSRNVAIEWAKGEILAFLDDDAVPAESWLEEMIAPYTDPAVIGTSGMPVPNWEGDRAPRWLPLEFYWTIGCGYRGLPTEVAPIRNPIGAAMSFRRTVFDSLGGFSIGFGPNNVTPSPHGGGEDTEFGIRARCALPGSVVLHVPQALVDHHVPRARVNFGYFRRRCWLEGKTKALLSVEVGTADGLSSEREYTLRTLPTGILKGLGRALRGDVSGLQQSSAIVAGLLCTVAGYLWGRLILLIKRR
jgi:GT2 family glycosyltransferase